MRMESGHRNNCLVVQKVSERSYLSSLFNVVSLCRDGFAPESVSFFTGNVLIVKLSLILFCTRVSDFYSQWK